VVKIDPATVKVILYLLRRMLADEEDRKRIIYVIAIPAAMLILLLSMIHYMLTMPLEALTNFFSADITTAQGVIDTYGCDYSVSEEVIAMLDYDGEYSPPVDPRYFNFITSHFGYRTDPFTKEISFHNGTDFSWGGCSGANIYAISDGVVTRAQDTGDGFGKCVVIKHADGVLTYYAHCSSIAVNVGDAVVKGQHISNIGTTGRSTGPHLHLGLKINGDWVNPLILFR